MNGALGYVRGFVWPENADPRPEADSKVRVPLCVVVEFDELNLGVDADGTPRSFFPGVPEKKNWVPIFPKDVGSATEKDVRRSGFPLVLAWAFTHWKSQGMNIPRTRVSLTNKTAGLVGLTACSRVRHPSQLLFVKDLPSWEAFQSQKYGKHFRAKARWSLRLEAKFSRTIVKYGFMGRGTDDQTHIWGDDDRRVASGCGT